MVCIGCTLLRTWWGSLHLCFHCKTLKMQVPKFWERPVISANFWVICWVNKLINYLPHFQWIFYQPMFACSHLVCLQTLNNYYDWLWIDPANLHCPVYTSSVLWNELFCIWSKYPVHVFVCVHAQLCSAPLVCCFNWPADIQLFSWMDKWIDVLADRVYACTQEACMQWHSTT